MDPKPQQENVWMTIPETARPADGIAGWERPILFLEEDHELKEDALDTLRSLEVCFGVCDLGSMKAIDTLRSLKVKIPKFLSEYTTRSEPDTLNSEPSSVMLRFLQFLYAFTF